MWEALEQAAWVKTLSTTGWMYASVSVVHYLTMFWFIGSIAIVDLRVMGIAARGETSRNWGSSFFRGRGWDSRFP